MGPTRVSNERKKNGNRPHRRDCPLEITVPCHVHRAPVHPTELA
jgi:hypothetical protein